MDLSERVPGMRRGSHLWNLLVAVAYLVFLPIWVPIAILCLADRIPWEC